MQVRLAPMLDRASGPKSLADAMAANVLKINDNFAIPLRKQRRQWKVRG